MEGGCIVITSEQILEATGKELSRIAGEVLEVVDVWPHDVAYVPLTWPEAMKWRDWGVKEFGKVAFHRAMYALFCDYDDTQLMIITYALPEHFIKAAILCKLKGDK
jgi:hypothetical protein